MVWGEGGILSSGRIRFRRVILLDYDLRLTCEIHRISGLFVLELSHQQLTTTPYH
jgi:hypothetical protein